MTPTSAPSTREIARAVAALRSHADALATAINVLERLEVTRGKIIEMRTMPQLATLGVELAADRHSPAPAA